MSVPNKSLDKNKRYAGVKANDFVNKTRANEVNRPGGMSFTFSNKRLISDRFFFRSTSSRLGEFRKDQQSTSSTTGQCT